MDIYINKIHVINTKIKNNSFYNFIEIDSLGEQFDINKNKNLDIFITDNKKYFKSYEISWLANGLEHYNNILKDGEYIFINCDMYDDFIEFKVSITKRNNKIYLNSIKHIIDIERIIFGNDK